MDGGGVNELKQSLLDNDAAHAQAPQKLVGKDGQKSLMSTVPLTLSWNVRGFSVSVRERNTWLATSKLEILKQVTGRVNPGQLLAILGPSGSGKTTMLDTLAGRAIGTLDGEVLVNGCPFSAEDMRVSSGYVMQDDVLLPNLTVRETLTYSALLMLPRSLTLKDKLAQVEQVIADLGLRDCAGTRIGNQAHRGISGGQKRRVSIGIQLLANPSILFLDEPTSGLDSFTANNIMESLLKLAKNGKKTIICTIHQPRSDIFNLLDLTMLLSKGQVVYFGKAEECVNHMQEIGFVCPPFCNPADFLLDIATVDYRSLESEARSAKALKQLTEGFQRSEIHKGLVLAVKNEQCRGDAFSIEDARAMRHPRPTHIEAFFVLSSRLWVDTIRDFGAFFQRSTQLLLFAVMLYLFMGRLGDNQVSVQNRIGILYETASAPCFIGMLNALAIYPRLRDVYYRERIDGMYSPLSFFFALNVVDLPADLLGAVLFSSFGYWALGLYPGLDNFLWYTLISFFMYFYGTTLGMIGLFLIRDPIMANNVSSLLITTAGILASGFIRSYNNLPQIVQWLSYVTIVKYGSQGIVYNEFNDLKLTCPPPPAYCEFKTGRDYLDGFFPSEVKDFYQNIGITIGYALTFRCLLLLAMCWRKPSR